MSYDPTYLPLVQLQGREFVFGEEGYPERFIWKTIYVGTGAEIGALEVTSGLVSVYPFNDSLTDVKGGFSLSGSVTYGSGMYGKALNLTSQRAQGSVQTVHEYGTSNFTLSAWIKSDAIGATQVIFAKRDITGNNKGFRGYINSAGKLVAEFCDGSAAPITKTGGTTLIAGKFYFVKFSFDRAGLMKIYINQVTDGDVSIATQSASIATNGQLFTVGGNSNTGSDYFDGIIDQLEVFSAAVSDVDGKKMFANLHSMQVFGCMETSGNFVADNEYRRTAENVKFVPRGIFKGTGAQIAALVTNGMTEAGTVALCTSSGSGYVINIVYVRNATDAGWIEIVSTDGVQAIVGKTIDGDLNMFQDVPGSALNPDSVAASKLTLFAAGTVPVAASDGEDFNIGTTYTKIKEFKLGKGGVFRTSWEHKVSTGTAFTKVYKNGVAFGTERSTSSTSFVAVATEDLTFADGDTIELWAKTASGGTTATARLFRIGVVNPLMPVKTLGAS